ncbi:MAG: hypothetical protein AAGN66_08635 [Acidobacteriota bacterium]
MIYFVLGSLMALRCILAIRRLGWCRSSARLRFYSALGVAHGLLLLLPSLIPAYESLVPTFLEQNALPGEFLFRVLTATSLGTGVVLLVGGLTGVATQVLRRRGIAKPPGRPLSIVSEFFSKRVRTEVLEPTLHDLLEEHFEALAEFEATGRRFYLWKARMVVVRGYWSFATAIVAQTPLSFAKWILKLWKVV